MAPLREKIGESFHKLNNRIHKRRASEGGESSQGLKQHKRTPSPSPKSSSTQGGPFLGWKPLGLSPSLHAPKPSDLLLRKSDIIPRSNSSGQPGCSTENPIDLTTDSACNRPSPAPSLSSLHSLSDDMVGSDGTLGKSRKSDRQSGKRRAPMETWVGLSAKDSCVSEASPVQDASVSFFREYLAQMSCKNPDCLEPITISWERLATRVRDSFDTKTGQGFLHSFLRCRKCKTFSCAGIQCSRHLKVLDFQQMESVSGPWCCDSGRQFLILAVACGPAPAVDDKTCSGSKAHRGAATAPPPTSGKKLSKSHRHKPKVSKLSQGTGYGGESSSHGPPAWAIGMSLVPQATDPPKAPTISKADQELEGYFLVLSRLLPSRPFGGGSSTFDRRSHTGTAEMLAKSPLLLRASEVLRRSCVEDMGWQYQLYFSLIQFLSGLSRHTDLEPLLFQPRTLYPESQQLGALLFGTPDGMPGPPLAAYDMTQSLYGLLQNLATFCRYFVENAERHPGELEDTDETRPLSVGKKLIAIVDELRLSPAMAAAVVSMDRTSATSPSRSLPNVLTRSRAAKMAAAQGDSQVGEAMAAWHREHCVEEVPDETIMEGFSFAAEAQAALKTQPSAKGRMRSLVTQVASLRTDLPQGIYVRHGISRLDVLKVLIIGPKGTPYENGIFEFDMFCGAKFPIQPPQMTFRTTGGGVAEFNPNLYVNGKVCLSLLGTWSGQSWEPHRSTILQVLVSIQGMIFNPTPWYNEPGREFKIDDTRSKAYNQTIWAHTLKHATLYWLKDRLVTPERSDTKGKCPVRNDSKAHNDTAPAATRTTTTSAFNIPPFTSNTHPVPAGLPSWAMEGLGDYDAGASFQLVGPVASKSVWVPQQTHLLQAPKVSTPAASYANKSGESSTSASNHPPLTAEPHPDQVPPGLPSFTTNEVSSGGPILGGKPVSSKWLQDDLEHLLPNWTHFPSGDGSGSIPSSTKPQTNAQGLKAKTAASPSPLNQFPFDEFFSMNENNLKSLMVDTAFNPGFFGLPDHPPRSEPSVGDAAPPTHDDKVWGETLRVYFSEMASMIVNTAVASPYHTMPLLLEQVKEGLSHHKFI